MLGCWIVLPALSPGGVPEKYRVGKGGADGLILFDDDCRLGCAWRVDRVARPACTADFFHVARPVAPFQIAGAVKGPASAAGLFFDELMGR